jgi:hypothetical protein
MRTLEVTLRIGQYRYLSGKQKRGLILADVIQRKILQTAADMQEFDNDKLGAYDEDREVGGVIIKDGFLNYRVFEGALKFDPAIGLIKCREALEESCYRALISLKVERDVERRTDSGVVIRHETLIFSRKLPIFGLGTKAEIFIYKFVEEDKIVTRKVMIERTKGLITVTEEVTTR